MDFLTQKITNPADFGKVAVLFGGPSNEREISLISGAAVLQALQNKGVDAHGIDAGKDLQAQLEAGGFDRVFIALHGRGGEDGQVQGLLEWMGLPYTGSGVMGSAIAMDKTTTKRIWRGLGMPTANYRVAGEDLTGLNFPVMVKPAHEGSSVGMSKVDDESQLQAAIDLAAACNDEVLLEEFITGGEYTVAILGGKALPMIRLETPNEFYDFEAKYKSNNTQYHCPCGLSAAKEEEIKTIAEQAFAAVGVSGWGRVDVMLDEQERPYLLEVNTVPGMTDHSLVPMAAKAVGVDFEMLCWLVLETSLESVQ